ncbi:MAG: O-antigen ligase family protein [Pseudomonadota bacterium]
MADIVNHSLASHSETTGRRRSEASADASARLSPIVYLFLFALIVPVVFMLGPVKLNPYRLVLVLAFIPLVFAWLSGKAGRIIAADLFIALYCAWAALALTVNHGVAESVEPAGILTIEAFGSYLLARVFIRNQQQFRVMVSTIVAATAILLPFAILEAFTSKNYIVVLFDIPFETINDILSEPRFGLQRAQGPFEHPILLGVFAASVFMLALLVGGNGAGLFRRQVSAGIAGLVTFFSLSVGAYIVIAFQIGLLAWERLTKGIPSRWKLLVGGVTAVYVTLDIIANRSPVQIFIGYLTFNSHNAWTRLHIWTYGTAEVERHPVFGIGRNDWVRPEWLLSSVDNFWLVTAMRYGLPALIALVVAMALIAWGVAKSKSDEPGFVNCQRALLFTLAGISLAICTVHLWKASFVVLLFLIGSGAWMIGRDDAAAAARPSQRSNQPRRTIPTRHGATRPLEPASPPKTAADDTQRKTKRKKGIRHKLR